jgi:hypothetical protein
MSRVVLGAVLLVSVLASGCVIYVSDDGDGYRTRSSSVAKHEQRNREVIAQLVLGTTLEQVRLQLGDPAFSEAWAAGGEEVRVLRYRTHRTHAAGDTTRDETTPLVFRSGRLAGIGEHAVPEPVSGSADPGDEIQPSYVWRYL